jgi:hypothetical protein
MQKNGLMWDERPTWHTVPVADRTEGAIGTIPVIDGRMLATNSGKTEFIGPHTNEARFWHEARRVAADCVFDDSELA